MTDYPRIAVVGSRGFLSQHLVERAVYQFPKEWTVVSGGAKGVDTWAAQVAKHWKRPYEVFEADWRKYGKSAGYIRNNAIVRNCDLVLAFWDGSSRGTKHTIQLAAYLKKPCIIVRMGHE